MTNSPYKRFSTIYPSVVATIALVVALVGVPGVTAGGLLVADAVRSADIQSDAVQSGDIAPGEVSSTDIGEGQVTSGDIGTGQVNSGDIGEGEVTPGDVTLPDPVQLQFGQPATTDVGDDFVLLADVGAYTKADGNSTGTARSPFGGDCLFQLRVDGQPSGVNGGLVFVASGPAISISSTALFPGLGIGSHSIEVWVRQGHGPGVTRCIVGPAEAGIPQTFVVSEIVV
jgi:hypothetical protein